MSSIYKLIVGRKQAIEYCERLATAQLEVDLERLYGVVYVTILERYSVANLLKAVTGEQLSVKAYEKRIPEIKFDQQDQGGPFLFEVPQELVKGLSTISSKPALSKIAKAWKKSDDQFTKWRESEVLDLLNTIKESCAQAHQAGKELVVFMCP
jgi:hypothetical protein